MLKRFINDERGLETVEYAVILALIIVGTIASVKTLGGWVKGRFDAVNAEVLK